MSRYILYMCCHFVYVVCIAILCMLYVLPFYDARACVTGHFFFPRARTWWMLFDFISFHCAHTLACRACMPYRVSACAYTHTLSLTHTHTHTCLCTHTYIHTCVCVSDQASATCDKLVLQVCMCVYARTHGNAFLLGHPHVCVCL